MSGQSQSARSSCQIPTASFAIGVSTLHALCQLADPADFGEKRLATALGSHTASFAIGIIHSQPIYQLCQPAGFGENRLTATLGSHSKRHHPPFHLPMCTGCWFKQKRGAVFSVEVQLARSCSQHCKLQDRQLLFDIAALQC